MSRRRVEGAALAAVLAVGGVVPVAQWSASAATRTKPKPPPPCLSWTDPADDASTAQEPAPANLTGDKNLDIVSTTFATGADAFSTVVKVSGLTEGASDAGDRTSVTFAVGGKTLEIYALRDGTGLGGDEVGLHNVTDGVYAAGKATAVYDVKGSTITISATLADLATIATVPVKGAKVTALVTKTRDDVANVGGFVYDTSATDSSTALGAPCGSSAAKPLPTPTAKPSATPKPTPGSPTAPQVSPDPTKDFPTPGCSTYTDPKGDAHPLNASAPADPDLDITSLTLRTTTTDLVAYASVDKLAAGTATFDAQRYTFDFTFNGHVFSAAGSSSANGSSALRDVVAATGQAGHVVQLGVDVPALTSVSTDKGFKASGLKVTYDLANSRVVFALPIADIEKYGMAKLAGKLTAVDVRSATDTNVVSSQADSTAKDNATTSTDTWTVNDNACFPKKK